MITAEDIEFAMMERNASLVREIDENVLVIADVTKWITEVERRIQVARECYNFTKEPKVEIDWDPGSGRPSIAVEVDIKIDTTEEYRESHKRYASKVRDCPAYRELQSMNIDIHIGWITSNGEEK